MKNWQRLFAGLAMCFAASLSALVEAEPKPATLEGVQSCLTRLTAEQHFESELLVKLSLNNGRDWVLHSAMSAIVHENELYLDIDEFNQSLDFAIERDGLMLSGWFLSSDRHFLLDISACHAVVAGLGYQPSERSIVSVDGYFYVSLSVLEQWFPFKLAYDPLASLVTLRTSEPLPAEKRLRRENAAAKLAQASAPGMGQYESVPYRVLGWPAVDLSSTTQVRQTGGIQSDSTRYKALFAGDLFWMQGRVSVYGSDAEGIERTSTTLFRNDDTASLLGPLRATQVRLGDISAGNDGLVLSSAAGRGLSISNTDLQRPNYFDNFELTGELPLGWDLEVYKNGQLVSYKPANEAGRFELNTLTLDYGNNDFTLVYYGPQGQIREERVRRVIGPGALRPGQFTYRFNVLRERDDNDVLGDERANVGILDLEYGVTRWLSLGAGWRSLQSEGQSDRYQLLTSTVSLPGAVLSLNFADQLDAGEMLGAQLQASVLGGRWALEHDQFQNYTSEAVERHGLGKDILRRSRVRADYRGRLNRLRLSFNADGERLIDVLSEKKEAEFGLSISGNHSALTLRHELNQFDSQSTSSLTARQRLLFSHRVGGANVRAEASYNQKPNAQLSFAAISTDWQWGKQARARLGLNYQHNDSRYSYNFGINRRFERLAAGLSASYTQGGDWTMSLSLSTSLSGGIGGTGWALNAVPQSSRSTVAAELYLDKNGNSVWDEGEEPVSGINLLAGSSMSEAVTDEQGRVTMSNLSTGRPVRIRPDESQLDPMWRVDTSKSWYKLRAAAHAKIKLPVVPTGALEGHVMASMGTSRRPIAGATIELRSSIVNSKIESYTGYDGYYYIEGLLPGVYRMRILTSDSCFTLPVRVEGGEFHAKTIVLEDSLTRCDSSSALHISLNEGTE